MNITKPTRPLARWEAASTYNIQMGRMLLFAGRGSGYMNSTWTFKGTDWVVNLDGVGYTSRPVFWYVSIPFGQAQGSYTSPITYSLVTSVSPVVP